MNPEQSTEISAGDPVVPKCAGCDQPAMQGNYPTPLCAECRHELTRLRLPPWIKFFAAGICVLFVFSAFNMSRTLSHGILLEHARKAIGARNYLTAENESLKLLREFPDNVDAKICLTISKFYNEQTDSLGLLFQGLSHVNLEDQSMVPELEDVAGKFIKYYRSDSLQNLLDTYKSLTGIPDTAWALYFKQNPEDYYARLGYASVLWPNKEYKRADSVINTVVEKCSDNLLALHQQCALRRDLRDFKGSLDCAEKMLRINHESVDGLSLKSRTYLCMHEDGKGLEFARKAYALDPTDAYAAGSLVLAYHFNNKAEERDALVKKLQESMKDSSKLETLQYPLDVISKKEIFRD